MADITPLPVIDPETVREHAPSTALRVPVRPNPRHAQPKPKAVPVSADGKAPKTKPCYGMTYPIRVVPDLAPIRYLGRG